MVKPDNQAGNIFLTADKFVPHLPWYEALNETPVRVWIILLQNFNKENLLCLSELLCKWLDKS